ncbi:gamma-glutamyltransferase [Fluviispira vulneris]|uniref:gamma-glutamyltransferase n=1 Tax=Fluviispira vulneris TaxID=2763012 RepID=UPI001647D424|nr:gamma-glutamyltransferase [Fluviispira vulneris]
MRKKYIKKTANTSLVLIFSLLSFQNKSIANNFPIEESYQIFQPEYSEKGMVASQEKIASEIGAQILKQGGNAVDAAVAVGYALAVTLPKAGNIGGGGFMLIWLNKEKKAIVINYREKAPLAAHKNMFLDKDGKVDEEEITASYNGAGVPGTVYGLNSALQKYGTMPLKKVMAPAIQLARNGILVTHALSKSLAENKKHLQKSEESTKIFFNKDKEPYKPGDILYQKDLANTLEEIALFGTDAFYKGKIAKKIIDDIQAHKGIMTLKDLEQYKAIETSPIEGTYNGFKVLSVPPPSSGGVTLIEILNILENVDFKKIPFRSAEYFHIISEAMNYAYYDRNNSLGDPDFVKNPIEHLTSKKYAKQIFQSMNLKKHTPSETVQKEGIRRESNQEGNTTHYSIVDKFGNMVSNTYTLNLYYGNGKTVKGTGILLNNEMDDFTAKVGAANSFGLVQGPKNSIEPQKRPLSSMTPTILLNDKKEAVLATGAPGGSRIITQTLLMITGFIDYNKNISTLAAYPRFHRQLWPDKFFYEDGIAFETIESLKKMGHEVEKIRPYGSLQTVQRDSENHFLGSSDPRSEGDAAVGVW